MPSCPPTPIRHQRKRRREPDAPADSDATTCDPHDPSSDGERSEKRVRRRRVDDSPARRRRAADSEGPRTPSFEPSYEPSFERRRPRGPMAVPTTGRAGDSAVRRESSSASQVSLSLLRGGRPKDADAGQSTRRRPSSEPPERSSPPRAEVDPHDRCNGVAGSDRQFDDFLHYQSSHSFHPNAPRSRIKGILLVYFLTYALAFLASSALFYALDFHHKLAALQHDSAHRSATDKYETLLEERTRLLHRFQDRVQTLERQLALSRQTIARLNRETARTERERDRRTDEYEAMLRRRDSEPNEALRRIRDSRRDDSEGEPIRTAESLAHRLRAVAREKDDPNVACGELGDALARVASEREHLEFVHRYTADVFLAPLLSHVRGSILASERRRAVILELTSLALSLRASLKLARSTCRIRLRESRAAVDAVAFAAGQVASRRTRRCEAERSSYAERMEGRLARTEEEALGAVLAVAEAAGKLEYERKAEEETRWRSYVREVEETLGGIGIEAGRGSESLDEGMGASREECEGADDSYGGMETSVLRAAISRRIEEGMASLRKYIHPYNYLREKRDSYPWESVSDE